MHDNQPAMAYPRVECSSLEEVRGHIDTLDREIVALLAARGHYVRQAARFKRTTDDVRAPQRVEQVIAKVRALAEQTGAAPDVIEAIYRTMIAAFTEQELQEHRAVQSSTD